MLGNLIGGFITILVGAVLAPTVGDQIWGARNINSTGSRVNGTNLPGGVSTILNLVTLFFCLGIMSAGIAITAQGLRAAGMLGVWTL